MRLRMCFAHYPKRSALCTHSHESDDPGLGATGVVGDVSLILEPLAMSVSELK